MGVVDLRKVIQGSGHLGERQDVATSVVLDLDEALLDVDVGRPVLAHRAELDEVACGHVLAQGEQQVERPDEVVCLSLHSVTAREHRVGSRRVLGIVHDGLREEIGDHAFHEICVLDVSNVGGDLAP